MYFSALSPSKLSFLEFDSRTNAPALFSLPYSHIYSLFTNLVNKELLKRKPFPVKT